MTKEIKHIFTIIILLTLISACTQKKNPVGFQNGTTPKSISLDWNIFSNSISFEDSTEAYSSNSKVLLGNFESLDTNKETKTLIRFINLPDTIVTLDSSIEIKMYIQDKHNFDDFSTIQFGELNQYWKENYATWFAATDSTSWNSEEGFSEADYNLFDPDSLVIDEDTLSIFIQEDMLINWVDNSSLNYGFVMFTEVDGFVEFYSAEADSISLNFSYRNDLDDTEDDIINYRGNATSDTFIYETDYDYQQYPDMFIASNIFPIRFFTKFNLTDSLFINHSDSDIFNSTDYNRMTINKAEIVLYYHEDNEYPLLQSSTLTPYLMNSDTLFYNDITQPLIDEDDYLYLYDGTSGDSINAEFFVLDVTNIVQNITSGEYENNGIIIKSIYENRDFFYALFATEIHDVEAKRPKLNIIYTPPYLDE